MSELVSSKLVGSRVVLDGRLPGSALATLSDLNRKHGHFVQFAVSGDRAAAFLVNDPALIEQVLARHHDSICRGFTGDRLALILGNGLLVSEAELWKTQRQLMHPLFHRSALSGFGDVAQQCNRALLERWNLAAEVGSSLELCGEMLDFSLEFNLTTIFGSDAPRIRSEVGEGFFEKLTEEPAGTTKENLIFLRDTERLRSLLRTLVEERRVEQISAARDLLDGLISARLRKTGAAMSTAQIVDELLSLLTAGHVTVASGLLNTWRILLREPATCQKLREEASAVCGGRAASADDFAKLSFTRYCVQEAMRLAPPIWIMTRRTTRDLELGASAIPSGSHLVVSPYLVHRHPHYWPDPGAFLPDRFLPKSSATRHRYCYLPFSAGPRSCLGDQLSLLQMTLHVASVIQCFSMTMSAGHFLSEPGFVYRSRQPLSIRIRHHERT